MLKKLKKVLEVENPQGTDTNNTPQWVTDGGESASSLEEICVVEEIDLEDIDDLEFAINSAIDDASVKLFCNKIKNAYCRGRMRMGHASKKWTSAETMYVLVCVDRKTIEDANKNIDEEKSDE